MERDLQLWADGRLLRTLRVGTTMGVHVAEGIEIAPGETLLELRTDPPPAPPGTDDGRSLGVAAYGIELDVQPAEEVVR